MIRDMLMCDSNLLDWHVVYTRHQHEKVVAETFAARGIENYLPLYRSVRQWKDRTKQLSLPLFPCYVFLRDSVEKRRDVLSTPGVHSIVKIGAEVASVPHAEVEAIRRAVESRLSVEPHTFLSVGERARITSGPLLGIEGIIVRKKGSLRLILSAELLEKSIAVEVDAFSVEPVVDRAASWANPGAWRQFAFTR